MDTEEHAAAICRDLAETIQVGPLSETDLAEHVKELTECVSGLGLPIPLKLEVTRREMYRLVTLNVRLPGRGVTSYTVSYTETGKLPVNTRPLTESLRVRIARDLLAISRYYRRLPVKQKARGGLPSPNGKARRLTKRDRQKWLKILKRVAKEYGSIHDISSDDLADVLKDERAPAYRHNPRTMKWNFLHAKGQFRECKWSPEDWDVLGSFLNRSRTRST